MNTFLSVINTFLCSFFSRSKNHLPHSGEPSGQVSGLRNASVWTKDLDFVVVVQFAQWCPTLETPWTTAPGFPVLHHLPEFAQTHVTESVMPPNHLVLCRPLLLLPSIFPSIRVFSNKSALCIR